MRRILVRFRVPLLGLLSLAVVALSAHFDGRPDPPAAQAVPVARAAAPVVRFTITDLGKIPEARTLEALPEAAAPNGRGAMAINDRGQVTGSFARAFLWDHGHTRDLGTLRVPAQGTDVSVATALNGRGQVVGTSGTYEPETLTVVDEQGFLYTNKAPHRLTELGDFDELEPNAISDAGQVVGELGQIHRGFFYAKGKVTVLGTLTGVPEGDGSEATSLNRRGQVVGSSMAPGPDHEHLPTHAFLWQRGGRSGRMRDLGTLPGWANSYARAINDRGEVAGTVSNDPEDGGGREPNPPSRAVLWRAGEMTDLGALPGGHGSEAMGLNNAGAIVGQSGDRAFLWESGTMRDLTALIPPGTGWVLTEARAINNKGQIAGNGTLGGRPHAFLLTPQEKSPR